MSTVTSHTLRPAKFSAGLSFGCVKPAAVGLPCASVGKNRPRSICYSVDTKSSDHPFNISPVALVHPYMPPTSSPRWEIKDDGMNVKLTLFNMPEGAKPADFQVTIEDDVLVIKTKPRPPAEKQGVPEGSSISFHIRLLVPKGYDKESVRAELQLRALVVTIPKVNPAFTKDVAIDGK